MSAVPVSIVFYRFGAHAQPVLSHELREQGFRHRFGETDTALRIGEVYGHHQDLVIADQLANRLRDLDPTAVFEIVVAPTGEYDGDRIVIDPDLGEYDSGADHAGRPVLLADDVIAGVEFAAAQITAGRDPAAVLAELDRAVGGPWQRRLAELRDTHRRATTPAHAHP